MRKENEADVMMFRRQYRLKGWRKLSGIVGKADRLTATSEKEEMSMNDRRM